MLCVARTWICEKFLITGWRIRNFRVRIRGVDRGNEGFELVLNRIGSNNIKLALRELSHEMMKALEVLRSDAKSKTGITSEGIISAGVFFMNFPLVLG